MEQMDESRGGIAVASDLRLTSQTQASQPRQEVRTRPARPRPQIRRTRARNHCRVAQLAHAAHRVFGIRFFYEALWEGFAKVQDTLEGAKL